MRNIVPVCLGLVVVSGIVSANMWLDLRAERKLTADLRTQLTAALGRPQAPAVQRNDPPQLANAAPEVKTLEAKPEAAPVPKVAAVTNPNVSLQNALNQEKEMMKDPEYRKARLMQQRMNIERNYPGLAEVLGMSDKETDKLFDLLAENQVTMSTEASILSIDMQNDQAAMQEMMRKQQALQRQQEDSVAALLGPDKYNQWKGYQETRGPRQQVVSLNTQLAQAGQPLNDSQQRALTTAYIAEQKRQREESQAMAMMARNFNAQDPQARAQMQEESLKRNEEHNRRLLEAAAPIVSAQQLATMKMQFESQAAMTRASQRARARIEAQNPGQTQQQGGIVISSGATFVPF